MLFVYGAVMTLIPMLVGYVVAAKLLKLSLFNNLGSITGGMTSTPALGTLIERGGHRRRGLGLRRHLSHRAGLRGAQFAVHRAADAVKNTLCGSRSRKNGSLLN